MLAAYKLRSRDLLADVDMAPKMLAKRKLSLLPSRSGSAGAMATSLFPMEEDA